MPWQSGAEAVFSYFERAIVGIFDKLRASFGNAELESGADADSGASARSERRRKKRMNARDDTRALIIDDSPTIVFALKKILRSSGFVTYEATDADAGIQLALTEKPDLIFLDIILPGANGFAVLRTLRRDPLTQHIPIIMISGNEQATELFFGSRIGADDFMKKPFSRHEVFARIERLLDADMIPRRIATSSADTGSEVDIKIIDAAAET
jgi:CheY-like chemotaxis protein